MRFEVTQLYPLLFKEFPMHYLSIFMGIDLQDKLSHEQDAWLLALHLDLYLFEELYISKSIHLNPLYFKNLIIQENSNLLKFDLERFTNKSQNKIENTFFGELPLALKSYMSLRSDNTSSPNLQIAMRLSCSS